MSQTQKEEMNQKQSIFQKLAVAFSTLNPYFTVQNILILLASIAITHFILQSIVQTMLYVNFLFIAHRIMRAHPTPVPPSEKSQTLRTGALIAALTSVVLRFAIASNPLLTFVLLAPLSSLFVFDCIQQLHHTIPAYQSIRTWIPSLGQSIYKNLNDEWDYFFIASPYLHQSFLSGLTLLCQLSIFSHNPALQTLYVLAGNRYLPPILIALSTIGGLNLLKTSQDAIKAYFTQQTQYAYHHVTNKVRSNPLLAGELLRWVSSFAFTPHQGPRSPHEDLGPSAAPH